MTNFSSFDWYSGNLTWLRDRTIFLTKHGSMAYGTNLPTSDIDLKGIAIAPKEYYLGFHNTFEQAEVHQPVDCTIYDIRKFFKLASDCNPNIIEILHTDESDWVLPSTSTVSIGPLELHHPHYNFWMKIWQNRHLFLSQKAQHTFSGYAFSQLKRLKSHRGYLINPPTSAPVRKDFGLPDGQTTIGKEQLGVINSQVRKLEDALAGGGADKVEIAQSEDSLVAQTFENLNLSRDLIPLVLAERRFGAAVREWSKYQEHLQNRNPARAALEASAGYDTKHAMHLVRLLRMAREILGDGKVIVKRPDAEELLAIRAGAWSYDQLIEYAERMEAELPAIAAKSPLPKSPDRKALDKLLVSIVESAL